jgi:hypothetical protein
MPGDEVNSVVHWDCMYDLILTEIVQLIEKCSLAHWNSIHWLRYFVLHERYTRHHPSSTFILPRNPSYTTDSYTPPRTSISL